MLVELGFKVHAGFVTSSLCPDNRFQEIFIHSLAGFHFAGAAGGGVGGADGVEPPLGGKVTPWCLNPKIEATKAASQPRASVVPRL